MSKTKQELAFDPRGRSSGWVSAGSELKVEGRLSLLAVSQGRCSWVPEMGDSSVLSLSAGHFRGPMEGLLFGSSPSFPPGALPPPPIVLRMAVCMEWSMRAVLEGAHWNNLGNGSFQVPASPSCSRLLAGSVVL